MTLLIALSGDAKPWLEQFRSLLSDRPIVVLGEPFDRRNVRYAVTWGPKPGNLSGLPVLEALFSIGAGVDHLMSYPDLPDVPIVRVIQDDLTYRMSEYVVMHCLMQLRDTRRYERQQKDRIWADNRQQPAAKEVRVGMMGFGVLGQDAALKLKMMGFTVVGWSRSPKKVEGFEVFCGQNELETFLARTDILISLLPLTPETQGILNKDLFRKLARDGRLGGPILINPGRGKLQAELDILACLDDGTLKAAVLDVFEAEPLVETSPFWSHPRVTITPHNAAMSELSATARYIVEQIRRHEAGQPWQNVVNPKRGY